MMPAADTTTNRDFIAEVDAALYEPPRFFVDTPQASEEIGGAWVAAWQASAHPVAVSARAPHAINPRRGR